MPKKNYYHLLEISRDAKPEEIKRAYHRLAHRFHPDKNPGNRSAEEHFKKINEAYAILQDMEKRAAYDRLSLIIEEERIVPRFEEFEDRYRPHPHEDFLEGILEDFFGSRRTRPRRARGADLEVNLEITLEEAAFGAVKELWISRSSACSLCGGSRCAPGTGTISCPSCRGAGSFRGQRGFFIVDSACGRCQGQGRIIAHPCPQCAGRGTLRSRRKFRVQVPAGVSNGTRLRLRDQGDMDRAGGQAGDLVLEIAVEKHPFFLWEGDDLLGRVSVTRREARRGTTVEVPTLGGSVTLKISPGTKSGEILSLKGEGMPSRGGKGRGDLRITVHVP